MSKKRPHGNKGKVHSFMPPAPRRRLPIAREEARFAAIGENLERLRAACDVEDRLSNDPVGIVHRFDSPLDIELVGLLASSLAFGNVTTIRAKIEEVLERLGGSPSVVLDDEAGVKRVLRGFVHRVFRGEDVAGLLIGARRVQREAGTLGRRFEKDLEEAGELRLALVSFARAIRKEGGLDQPSSRRGPAHLLPDPSGTSACKRLVLYLRWMIRPDDGIDFGLWRVHPRLLVIPVDTHIHKLSRNLGFTTSRTVTWKTAEEITRALSRYDAEDPVKYDFSLCHMGMLQRCPSRRDATRCSGCPVQGTCRHWPHERARSRDK